MNRDDLKKFIFTPQTVVREEIPQEEESDFHRFGLIQKLFGSTYSFINEEAWPNGPFQNLSGSIRILKEVPPQYVIPHIEDHDQVQIFLGALDHPDSLTVEIILEDQKFNVKSPFMAVYPKGIKHAEHILSGSGWFLTTHLAKHCVYYGKPPPSCPVEVGKIYDVKIEEVSRQGQGIARIKGFVLFVPGTKPEDYVKVRVQKISLLSADTEIVQ